MKNRKVTNLHVEEIVLVASFVFVPTEKIFVKSTWSSSSQKHCNGCNEASKQGMYLLSDVPFGSKWHFRLQLNPMVLLLQFLHSHPLLSGHNSELDAVIIAIHNQACSTLYSTEEKEHLLDRISLAISHALQNPFKYQIPTEDRVDHHTSCSGNDTRESGGFFQLWL